MIWQKGELTSSLVHGLFSLERFWIELCYGERAWKLGLKKSIVRASYTRLTLLTKAPGASNNQNEPLHYLVFVFLALSVEGKGYCRCWLTGFITCTVDFRDNESAFAMDIWDCDWCCIYSFVSRVTLQNFYQEHFLGPTRTKMKAFYLSCDTWGHPISNDSGGISWWIHTEESVSDIILYLAPTNLEFHSVLDVFHGPY